MLEPLHTGLIPGRRRSRPGATRYVCQWSFPAALALAGVLCAPAAVALPDDRDQPIYVQSDRAERDERKGTTVYTGEVEIDQGSLHISADSVTIRDADEQVNQIEASGDPAKMRQKPAPDREPVYARARTIQYDVVQEVLTLVEEASVTQEGTTVTGDRIVYFVREQRVKATGGGTTPGQERVKVVIPPRRAAAAAPAAGTADGTP
jgi:lipopolysaccharide export system protein LptA